MFKPKSTLFALFMFLPITPSIAAITVFTKSIIYDRTNQLTPISHHSKRVINATNNQIIFSIDQSY